MQYQNEHFKQRQHICETKAFFNVLRIS